MSRRIKIVFVHGWGMNSAVWESCIEKLPDWLDVELIDLPGHGLLSGEAIGDFDSMVSSVATIVKEPAILVGWSLGGLVCLKLAERYPEKIMGLCLVATNPCFVERSGWQSGIAKSVFEEFSLTLKHDIDKTIRRFLALQVAGSKVTMSAVKKLQNSLQRRGYANADALNLGLKALSEIDLRVELQNIGKPMQWILGAKDSLVPITLAGSLQTLTPDAEVVVIDQAAHAPFISHPDAFMKSLMHFSSSFRDSHEAIS